MHIGLRKPLTEPSRRRNFKYPEVWVFADILWIYSVRISIYLSNVRPLISIRLQIRCSYSLNGKIASSSSIILRILSNSAVSPSKDAHILSLSLESSIFIYLYSVVFDKLFFREAIPAPQKLHGQRHPFQRLSLRIVCMDVRWRLRGKPGVRRSPVQAVGTIAGSCRDIWSRRLGSAAGNPSTGCVGC